jgi:hypothetical protein
MLSDESEGNQIRYELCKAVDMYVLDSCRTMACINGLFG